MTTESEIAENSISYEVTGPDVLAGKWLTARECADLLQVSPGTIRRLVASEGLRWDKSTKYPRISTEVFEAMIARMYRYGEVPALEGAEWLSIGQCAEASGVSGKTMRRHLEESRVPHLRFVKKIRVHKPVFEEFLSRRNGLADMESREEERWSD